MNKKNSKTVSLVLGSGGARGLAHIGVIRWMEKNGHEIKAISGCSIGSLIGGVYAAGKLDELEKWMLSIEELDIVNLLDLSWGRAGLFKGDKIIKTLIELLEDIQIEDLDIPYTAVATDIATEKEVWINSGSLFDAIRASISLPLFFTPVRYKDSILIDGGVLNPVPIAPTFKYKTDLTIAVNLGGDLVQETKAEELVEELKDTEFSFEESLRKFFRSIQKPEKDSKDEKIGMYEVMDRAFDTMQSAISRQKIAAYPPDMVIEIPRNACGTLEFDRAKEMIDLGFKTAKRTFKTIGKKA